LLNIYEGTKVRGEIIVQFYKWNELQFEWRWEKIKLTNINVFVRARSYSTVSYIFRETIKKKK
jgi:hypothetical protein